MVSLFLPGSVKLTNFFVILAYAISIFFRKTNVKKIRDTPFAYNGKIFERTKIFVQNSPPPNYLTGHFF